MLITMTMAAMLAGATADASVASPGPAAAAKQARTQNYENARYGTRAFYPTEIFRRVAESDNGDGITLESRDGARLLIYAGYNLEDQSPRAYLANRVANERGRVTYRHVGRTYAVMSGIKGDRTFYQRFEFEARDGGIVHAFYLEYPTRLQARYGPIVRRISVHGPR